MKLIVCPHCGSLHDLDSVPGYSSHLNRPGKFCPIAHYPLDATALASYHPAVSWRDRDNVEAAMAAVVADVAAQQADDRVLAALFAQRSDRFYPFVKLPTQVRNTLGAGNNYDFDGGGPGVLVSQATAGNNKVFEAGIEQFGSDIFIDGITGKTHVIEGYIWTARIGVETDFVGNRPFAGIEMMSYYTSTFGENTTPLNPVIQLRQYLDNQAIGSSTVFELLVSKGDGVAPIKAQRTIAPGQSLGHHVRLMHVPGVSVKAWVDGLLVGTVVNPTYLPNVDDDQSKIYTGIILNTGTPHGAGTATFHAMFCAFHVANVGAYALP